MTRSTTDLEVWHCGQDYPFVVIGAHLTLEEARAQFGEEYDEYWCENDPAVITAVRHCWSRYEFVGDDNCPSDPDYDPEPGEALWIVHDRAARPEGVVRRATVIV